MSESLFYSLSPATLLKCSLWRRCFPVDFAKFLRAHFLQNSSGGCFCGSLQLYKNKTSPRVFFCNLSKNFRNIFFFLMYCKNFLKVHKNTGEKMFAKNISRWLFRKKINTINNKQQYY